MIDADNKTLLKRLKITHILNMAKEAPCFHPKDFEYLHIKGNDVEGYNIGQNFNQITEFIHKALTEGTGVFVHCVYGISRGSTAIIAFLMRFKKMIYTQARRLVERARPHIYPNFGFVRHLKNWAKKLEMEKASKKKGSLIGSLDKKSFFDNDYLGNRRSRKKSKYKSSRTEKRRETYKPKSKALRAYNRKRGITQSLRPSRHQFVSTTTKNIDNALKIGNLSAASEENSIDPKDYNPSNHVPKHNVDWLNKPAKSRLTEPSNFSAKTQQRGSNLSKILKPMVKNMDSIKHEWRMKSLDIDPMKISRFSPKKNKIKARKFLSTYTRKPRGKKNNVYVCKSCKCRLAYSKNIIPHEPESMEKCDSIFFNKMNWMKADYLGYRKLLICPNPKCRAVLGMMCSSGVKCSCGYTETPGFQIKRAAVVEKKGKGG